MDKRKHNAYQKGQLYEIRENTQHSSKPTAMKEQIKNTT